MTTAANYLTDTPRGRMFGASWNFDPAQKDPPARKLSWHSEPAC